MKKYIVTTLAILTIIGIGCKKSSTASNKIVGNWAVSSYIKDSVDITNQFSSYTFICSSNGKLSIQSMSNTYSCNWNWNDDSYTMCNVHIMGCGTSSILWELQDDWDLTSSDQQYCYFTNHNPNRHCRMVWIKK